MPSLAQHIAGLTTSSPKSNDAGRSDPALLELVRALARLDAREDHEREMAARDARRDLR